MSHLLDQDDQLLAGPSRDLTLSTGSILSIFVGLALLCGLFYGFGYNMGHKSALASLSTAAGESTEAAAAHADPADTFNSFKPAAGSPTARTTAPSAHESPLPAPGETAEMASNAPGSSRSAPSSAHPAIIVRQPPAAATTSAEAAAARKPGATAPASPASNAATAASPAGGVFVVQVAAVSHQEDADLLLGALRARGYAVTARSESSDKLIHIQVGPFPSKPAADVMRQRLMVDGYNAIIK